MIGGISLSIRIHSARSRSSVLRAILLIVDESSKRCRDPRSASSCHQAGLLAFERKDPSHECEASSPKPGPRADTRPAYPLGRYRESDSGVRDGWREFWQALVGTAPMLFDRRRSTAASHRRRQRLVGQLLERTYGGDQTADPSDETREVARLEESFAEFLLKIAARHHVQELFFHHSRFE